jgi:hypothetical protein
MAGNDVFLRSVPPDSNPNDIRLRDPTQADSTGGVITANLSVTEADDTLSAAATLAIATNLTATEADDTLASSAALAIAAALSVTEASDTLAATAAVLVSTSLAVTEAADTLSSTASVLVSPSLAVTEAADTLSSGSVALVSAALAITEADDSLSSLAAVLALASLSQIEVDDSLSATVATGGGVNADLNATEDNDQLSGFCVVFGAVNNLITSRDELKNPLDVEFSHAQGEKRAAMLRQLEDARQRNLEIQAVAKKVVRSMIRTGV